MSRTKVLITFERPKGSRKKGKKNRKHGRNKKKCEAYRKANKHEHSHIKRLVAHISIHSRDRQAKEALEKYRRNLFSGGVSYEKQQGVQKGVSG